MFGDLTSSFCKTRGNNFRLLDNRQESVKILVANMLEVLGIVDALADMLYISSNLQQFAKFPAVREAHQSTTQDFDEHRKANCFTCLLLIVGEGMFASLISGKQTIFCPCLQDVQSYL